MTGPAKHFLHQGIRILQKIEEGFLICLLLLMVFLAAFQIFARNLFDSGIRFGDELIRMLVLWISLMGAMVASRTNSHVNIDLFSRYLPAGFQKISKLLVCVFTSFICLLMAFFSYQFVMMEKADGSIAFSVVPAWICQSIMPAAFAIISIRYALTAVTTLMDLLRPDHP